MQTKIAHSRRTMLKAGAAACLATSLAASRILGANEQLRVGVIGTGVRGKYLIANMPEAARVVTLGNQRNVSTGDGIRTRNSLRTEAFETSPCTIRVLRLKRQDTARSLGLPQAYAGLAMRMGLMALVILGAACTQGFGLQGRVTPHSLFNFSGSSLPG